MADRAKQAEIKTETEAAVSSQHLMWLLQQLQMPAPSLKRSLIIHFASALGYPVLRRVMGWSPDLLQNNSSAGDHKCNEDNDLECRIPTACKDKKIKQHLSKMQAEILHVVVGDFLLSLQLVSHCTLYLLES